MKLILLPDCKLVQFVSAHDVSSTEIQTKSGLFLHLKFVKLLLFPFFKLRLISSLFEQFKYVKLKFGLRSRLFKLLP